MAPTSGPAVLGAVREALADRAAGATDPRVTVGRRAVLVECRHPDAGSLAGVAHRPRAPAGGSDGDADLGSLAGSDGDADVGAVAGSGGDAVAVARLAAGATDAPAGSLARAVGVAALCALSTPDVDWRGGDPMATLAPAVETVATVGLFRPAFRWFDDVTVRVVERDPDAVDAASLPDGVPTTLFAPDEAAAAFAGCDACFVTGSTLVYGGVDDYLTAAADAGVPLVAVVGASASVLPGPLFDRGVDVVAGARVDDAAGVRRRVAAGDCGTDLHDAGLRKVYCASGARRPGTGLRTERTETEL